MKFFIILIIISFFVLFLLLSFVRAFLEIKKQANELDQDAWIRLCLGTATEEDIKKHREYKSKQDKKESELKDFKERIEKAKRENQNIEQIMLIFDELTNKYPTFEYFTEKADLYIENKLYDKALAEYKKAIGLVKEREFFMCKSYGYYLISKMYSDINDHYNAIKYAAIAIKIHNGGYMHVDFFDGKFCFTPVMYSKDMAYNDGAEIYFKAGKYKLALKCINNAIKECALESRLIFRIKILIKLNQFYEAEKMCKKYFLNDKPNLANYNACMAYIAHAQNRFKEAFDFYTKALNEKKDELCFYEIDIIRKNRIECRKAIKNNV